MSGGMSRGMDLFRGRGGYAQGWVPTPLPPLLTPSNGHHMYGRQAGRTHPTGMHSFYSDSFVFH